ncbi:hypothetical protein JZO70_01650 [Enterococcus sp. 669A]|uniref:Uncharacterized protein n=1 Tax=Candidatus Enterococcus moelleringii TaxID=2815325 RepID=A0ABS3L8U4_9ENTE|nr:hypothetical protein [Enterococcus sp. 669A]MBO1304849.1 hypothetical protein [Enterococcus sp. 669A]
MKKKPEKAKKNLIKAFSSSSFRFLSDFLNDSADKRAQEQANETIMSQLRSAALHNSLVVLQVQHENDPEKFQTVSGWLPKTVGNDSLVVRTQDNQLQMLTVDRIKKVTTLAPNGDQERVSR